MQADQAENAALKAVEFSQGVAKRVADLEGRFLTKSRRDRFENRRLYNNVIAISNHGLSVQELDMANKRDEVVFKALEILGHQNTVTLVYTEKFLTGKSPNFNLKGSKIHVKII